MGAQYMRVKCKKPYHPRIAFNNWAFSVFLSFSVCWCKEASTGWFSKRVSVSCCDSDLSLALWVVKQGSITGLLQDLFVCLFLSRPSSCHRVILPTSSDLMHWPQLFLSPCSLTLFSILLRTAHIILKAGRKKEFYKAGERTMESAKDEIFPFLSFWLQSEYFFVKGALVGVSKPPGRFVWVVALNTNYDINSWKRRREVGKEWVIWLWNCLLYSSKQAVA